jgi:ABC-2 type transport system ATP-binding protein
MRLISTTTGTRPVVAAHPDTPAIRIDDVEKRYGAVHALRGVSLTVAQGEIFGLLGQNGAGKTTTVRVLSGRTRPTAGHASILGMDVIRDRDRIKPLINLVFEEQNVYPRMSGRENVRFFAELYGVDPGGADDLLGLVGFEAAAHRRAGDYSTGMKQRLLIARALVNRPRVLFLDEPTRGLDPASARDLRALIASLSEQGTTILLTTHDLDDADALCHRVGFLAGGRLVALDTPRELKLRVGDRGVVLTVHSREGTLADVFVALATSPAPGPTA